MDQILYGIKSIKEIEYFVDESMELEDQVDFFHNVNIESKIALDEIHFTISVHFRRKGTIEDHLRSKTVSVFAVQKMKEMAATKDGKEAVNLPDQLLITLYSISFTHARAMLARSAAGTKYGHMIMPLVNPEIEFKKIFVNELKQ